jgi:hypothetical protein
MEGITKLTIRHASGSPTEHYVVGHPGAIDRKMKAAMRAGKATLNLTSARTGQLITIDLMDGETYSVKPG